MRAASFGIPFQPIAGLEGSDIPAASGFQKIKDPYSDRWLYAIPAIKPDWAILHVPESDERGNARIYGSPYWDRVMSRAARRVILVAERIVPTQELAERPELTTIPEILVEAVVHLPRGASPASCHPYYSVDEPAMWRYLECSRSRAGLDAYLAETAAADHVQPVEALA